MATERAGHTLEVYVRPGVETDGAVRVADGQGEDMCHGRHLRRAYAAGLVGGRPADLVKRGNARAAPDVPGPTSSFAATSQVGLVS
ncbi:hypothetical protein J2Z21_005212 [Streptomyces griseochromogenes]|uniref:Uncharacterized protein n=1 Tax=Streptomyces griseochromogenes TaxID=68214 RepID=A0A1B1AWB2_9ACTN|nr:hypothetical protein [Streptomyces griseochromogenes]ANP50874.1 hypothetical protein AVL59_15685 [Streptomyces griseochromogenes]MBP2052230.1 hypothetical protein [Streptomyces griseochromogenes]